MIKYQTCVGKLANKHPKCFQLFIIFPIWRVFAKCWRRLSTLRTSWVWSSAEVRKSCRSSDFKKECKIGSDIARNEHFKIVFSIFSHPPDLEVQRYNVRVLVSRPGSYRESVVWSVSENRSNFQPRYPSVELNVLLAPSSWRQACSTSQDYPTVPSPARPSQITFPVYSAYYSPSQISKKGVRA